MTRVLASEKDAIAIEALERKIEARADRLLAREMAAYWDELDSMVECEFSREPDLARWATDGGRCA